MIINIITSVNSHSAFWLLFADEHRHLRVHVRTHFDHGAEKPDATRVTVEQKTIIRSGKCRIPNKGGESIYSNIHTGTYNANKLQQMVTVILIGVCLFVACSSRIKVQSLVDFNEIPAEENLPLVCQITPGVPCMPPSHHCPIVPTDFLFICILPSQYHITLSILFLIILR